MVTNPLATLEKNGVAEASSLLAAQQSCLDRLSQVSVVADAADRTRQSLVIDLAATAAGSAMRLMNVFNSFQASGTGLLLRALPFSAATFGGLSRLSLLGASVAAIRRTLGIDLLHPRGLQLLTDKLHVLAQGPMASLSVTPSLPISGISSIAQLAAATGSLRNAFNIDIFQSSAAARLRSVFGQLTAAPFLRPSAGPVLRPPTLAGLQGLAAFAAASLVAKQHLGIDLRAPGAAAKLAGLTSLLALGRSPAGSFVLPSVPQFQDALKLRGMLGGVHLAQQHFSLRLLDPNAGVRLRGLFGSLSGGGICRTVSEVDAHPVNLDNIRQIDVFASTLQSTRSVGLDLTGKDAAQDLARTVDRFRDGGADEAIESLDISDEVLASLDKLSAVGEAARALAHEV